MNKKILIFSLIISLLFVIFCSTSFANLNNTIENSTKKTGSLLHNAGEHLENGVSSAANGMANVGSTMMSGARNLGNDVMTGAQDMTDGDYTAERTATTGNNNFLGMSSTTWTWMILAITTVAIVALVWYYGSQYEHKSYNND